MQTKLQTQKLSDFSADEKQQQKVLGKNLQNQRLYREFVKKLIDRQSQRFNRVKVFTPSPEAEHVIPDRQ